jgi:hypothetical protein
LVKLGASTTKWSFSGQQRHVLGTIQQGIRQKRLEVARPQDVRWTLELQHGDFTEVVHQTREDLSGLFGQLALLLADEQDVDLQRFLADGDFLFQFVMAVQLQA